jgi:hypothetical protein
MPRVCQSIHSLGRCTEALPWGFTGNKGVIRCALAVADGLPPVICRLLQAAHRIDEDHDLESYWYNQEKRRR